MKLCPKCNFGVLYFSHNVFGKMLCSNIRCVDGHTREGTKKQPVGRATQGMKPLAIDLYSGLGGWASGFLAEGYTVIGFDIERHRYPKFRLLGESTKVPGNNSPRMWKDRRVARLSDAKGEQLEGWEEYPGQLVLQDVTTLHGSQFKNAAVIVASPPCQAYSYRAMPWKRAKALPPPDNTLFDACFRIQREASEAAGRYIPLIVENVRGAQKWVGKAAWHFGSYFLWGDVPALMPITLAQRMKSQIPCGPRRFEDRVATTPEQAHALHYRL